MEPKRQKSGPVAGDVKLRSKKELIEKFIEENLLKIKDTDSILMKLSDTETIRGYWFDYILSEEEHLNKDRLNFLIGAYIYNVY
ncbi:type I restriction endonuclease subunit R, EcoR124 family [Salinimicrobium tongyeongense]|uniref:type I restriction endonuclease subunit R, EcoR124 family n=1 Tax=Salinimicrobium tongyeongense TaxID=2809707 RepID=UPI003530CEFC